MAEFAAMEVLHLCRLFLLLADPYPTYESSLLVLHILDNSQALGLLEGPLLFVRN
jgi:hypothetical protein